MMDSSIDPLVTTPEMTEAERALEEEKLVARFFDRIRGEQNFGAGLIAGLVAAALSAAAWAIIAVGTQRTFGLFAIVVGLFVAFAVRRFGRGLSQRFAILGAGLALLGCLAGNVSAAFVMAGQQFGMTTGQVLQLVRPDIVWEILRTTSPLSLIFFAIAAYEGFRFSLRRVTDEEVVEAIAQMPQGYGA